METVIVICLLIIISLLLQEKIVIYKKTGRQPPEQQSTAPALPDIMGRPKHGASHAFPKSDSERQRADTEANPDNFETEYGENKNAGVQIPQEELDEVFRSMPDFEEEEEEWSSYGISGADDSLAQGVTYDELSSLGALLHSETLENAQKEAAIAVVQKIQGTELFSLLENSVEGASKKIAMLLDSRLSKIEPSSSLLRKNDFNDFDIGEFV